MKIIGNCIASNVQHVRKCHIMEEDKLLNPPFAPKKCAAVYKEISMQGYLRLCRLLDH